jgi:hypothetical protein
METERVTAHRTALSGPLLLSVALVVVGLLVLRGSVVFGVIFLAVFGAFLLYAVAEALVPAAVELTPTALRARTLLGRRAYAWDDCHDFHVWTEGRRAVVVFGYRGAAKGALSDADARRAQADRALPALQGVPAEDLLGRIEDFRTRLSAPPAPAPRPKPSPRPSPR